MKFLFESHFKDGTHIHQNDADVSSIDPTKSTYYDVIQKGLDDVVFFAIYSDKDIYLVDLRDGHFEVNGAPFNMCDPSLPIDQDTQLRLIYYRQHSHTIGSDGDELTHDVTFHIGWQTTIDGKNYQRTIGVS